MDTDDLTKMAWDVIVRAARVSDTLKAELGAMASRDSSLRMNGFEGFVPIWKKLLKTPPSMLTIGTLKTRKLSRQP